MNKTSSRSALFLLEMIFVIFFFALTAAVYVRIFASARSMADQSRDLTQSVIAAQNLAELFYASDGDITVMRALIGGNFRDTSDPGTLILSYDGSWEAVSPSSDEDAPYYALVTIDTDGDLRLCDIALFAAERPDAVYALSLTHYAAPAGKEDAAGE